MLDSNILYSSLAARINEMTGLHLQAGAIGSDGTPMVTLPAAELLTVAGIVEVARDKVDCQYQGLSGPPLTPNSLYALPADETFQETFDRVAATLTSTSCSKGRAGVDWSAAGKKSWETRRRNEAARKAAKKGSRSK